MEKFSQWCPCYTLYYTVILNYHGKQGCAEPDPNSNPDKVGQYNPEHRFSTAIVRGWR